MIVCIAEKPSVARDIANILEAHQPKGGYYEGNGYQVTWTFGHLCTLKEPHEYSLDWKRWDLASLPMIPPRFGIKLIEQRNIEKQFNVISFLMKNASMIVNCGDAGQEGELIQRWVIQKAGATCPVKRLWISSLTEESIKEGFTKLKDEKDFQPLYEAGLARAIGDWLLGMNATRLYTLRYGRNRQVLSVGRVQTPTLALIVNRQREIENFVSTPYWELKTLYRGVVFNSIKGKYLIKEEAQNFLETIKGKDLEVTSIREKKGSEYPPKLFDLTSLQVECNKKYGFSADETLKLIQSLYERKLTTYPRVDTTFLSNDIYPKCPGILKGLRDYQDLTALPLSKKLLKSNKVFNDAKVTDHHAIIPTGVYPDHISEQERKVFDLIAKRFIACFYPACKIATTTVEAKVEKVKFKATGKQLLDLGWRIVFAKDTESNDSDKSDNKDKILPHFVKGESGEHEPSLLEKWTNPPKPYTEATLLRAMETAGKFVDQEELSDALKENGIGRPSTRAAIIETLFKRKYISKERKNLVPTQLGTELIDIIDEELLKSAELTGLWEKKLREIERKGYDASQFIEELKLMVKEVVNNVLHPNKKVSPLVEGAICPKCGVGRVIKGNSAYGCSEWKKGCDFRSPFNPSNG